MRYNCIIPSVVCLLASSMFGLESVHGRSYNTTFFEQTIPANNTQGVFANRTYNFCNKPLVNYLPWRIRYKLGKQCLKSGNWLLTSTKDSLNEKMSSLSKSADLHRQTVANAAKSLQQSIGISEKIEKPKFERVRIIPKWSKLHQTSNAQSAKTHHLHLGLLVSVICIFIGFTAT